MIKIPTLKPAQTQLITTIVGVSLAVLGYFFPALVPAFAPIGKLLWASGLATAGAGAIQLPGKGEP